VRADTKPLRLRKLMTTRHRFGGKGATQEAANRRTETFRQFVERVSPRFIWYGHCERAAAILQRVADGELDRVIVMWPPRHSKTELFSRLFPAYYLSRYPERWVGLASYAAALAYKISRAARDNARAGGVTLRDDAEAVHEWETTAGGGFWAAGVGGPATGKGMHLGLIDDPIKNAEEAASAVIADRNQDWWGSTWYTRQEPNAALVVVTTRWPGPGDLVGWLFDQESNDDEHAEHWHVVAFEAEKSAEPYEIPPTCTLEPDPRQPGEALCPERYPVSKLRKIAARIGSFFYRSLFLQRKSTREGAMFKWAWWQVLSATPIVTGLVRYWDLAGTEPSKKGHDPDFTASVLAGRMPDKRCAILDVTAFRESVGQRDAKIEAIAREDRMRGIPVTWWFEQETGVGGSERTASLVRRIQAIGLAVNTEPATGSKILRAEPLASAAEAGNVCLSAEAPSKPWHDRFRAHMADFSAHCDHDDIADAASGAYNKLATPTASIGFSSISI
jgi:predicted phage terminase large subunit-like protein